MTVGELLDVLKTYDSSIRVVVSDRFESFCNPSLTVEKWEKGKGYGVIIKAGDAIEFEPDTLNSFSCRECGYSKNSKESRMSCRVCSWRPMMNFLGTVDNPDAGKEVINADHR